MPVPKAVKRRAQKDAVAILKAREALSGGILDRLVGLVRL